MADYHQVKSGIQQGRLAPVYFFFGEETRPIDELIRELVTRATDPETRDFNCDILDAENADIDRVLAILSSFPMMADRRLVVLKSVEKLSSSEMEKLSARIESPVSSACLALTAGKIDRRKKFYAHLIGHSLWLECKPLYENQAVAWVKREMQDRGLPIRDEAAAFLVHTAGTSLNALTQEMDKLQTYAWDARDVDLATVLAVAGFSRNYNTWEFTDAVARKDAARALSILRRLLQNRQSPVGMLIDLARRMIQLLHIRLLLEERIPEAQILSHAGLKPFFARLYIGQARLFHAAELDEAIRILLRADQALKSGWMEPELVMTLVAHDLITGSRGNRFFF
ncbi:MAG: DNA polymerase III subunit delta [Acidobacteria bacterium]|nr:DNA polymerase III subunit delta [Acidobacteriota bacterium]